MVCSSVLDDDVFSQPAPFAFFWSRTLPLNESHSAVPQGPSASAFSHPAHSGVELQPRPHPGAEAGAGAGLNLHGYGILGLDI